MKLRALSAADKYRELETVEKSRPGCGCHGEPLSWCKRKGRRNGGSWRCTVKRRAADARYYESDKGWATRARYSARYYMSPGYVAAQRRYYSNATGAYVRWRKRRYAALIAHLEKRMAELDAQIADIYAKAGRPMPKRVGT
jgi:hypothetical protein